jgi:outer membrane protein OmpA-like peptidoglycan-associated protein
MRSSFLFAALACAVILPAAAQDTAPPAVPAGPGAALMTPPRTFTIFFEHAEPQIPEEAQSLLPQIAEIYARVGYTAIAIECHSDNVASQAINIPLTEDRARRIKTELVRYGVPDAAVTAVGLGFSDPLVPDAALDTAVSNRRCVVSLT